MVKFGYETTALIHACMDRWTDSLEMPLNSLYFALRTNVGLEQ